MKEAGLRELKFLTPSELRVLLKSRENTGQIRKTWDKLEAGGIRLVTLEDSDYPPRLLNIYGSPCGLYVKGRLPLPLEKSVAIVGARECSHYGREMARLTGRVLAEAGIQVISGMATGIDRAVHIGALESGTTFAIMGCGVDRCYPRENFDIYQEMAETGGILSEFPPGSPAVGWHFPQRNRIISGLADLIVVIEARKKSGSLITAEFGMEQGKDVFALPGLVTDPLSEGCHQLIKNGAGLLSSPNDILEILVPKWKKPLKSYKEIENSLVLNEKKVYIGLDFQPKSLEEAAVLAGLSVQETAQVLISLEIKGIVRRTGWNQYARTME